MAQPKRRLTSTQPSSQSSTTSSSKPPPAKRARREEPDSHQPTSLDPSSTTSVALPTASTEQKQDSKKLPLPEPKKRTIHSGSLRRLSSGRPSRQKSRQQSGAEQLETRDKQTLNGHRIGGKSKDLKDGIKLEEIWVSSKGANAKGRNHAGGIGFSAWLKKGVGAFVERGCTCLKIHGMGATIPTALSLSLAIRDAVPGGSPLAPENDDEEDESEEESDGGEYDPEKDKGKKGKGKEVQSKGGIFRLEVRTGTTIVGDEITPEDDDEDMIYQTRSKSTVEVTLTLDEELGKLVGVGKRTQQRRGHQSTRGGKRRAAGGTRGGGGGSGRGRGRGQ
ncbi:uncharacterized protein JCM6883_000978 [Sporobolomyces salmoneus]|uniref:uncharacterized protein n=1 Tax=Sporobolomyces salmoneus TaxID=183962 RepID=UPI003173DF2E